ncbi:MAG: hypothetical protein QM783_12215 [Phycisphaerales bacterium]
MADAPAIQKQQPLTAASRLVSGGLSFLLVLAFALASGVPTSRVLATAASGTSGSTGLERAVAPQTVERHTHQLQQERPDAASTLVDAIRRPGNQITVSSSTAAHRAASLLREALLALPPPAV